jgi:hypothetical protein
LLPKGYDPLLPGGGLPAPNPERWLPKWQRSEFKKKKITSAQRKSEVVKGSQVSEPLLTLCVTHWGVLNPPLRCWMSCM